LIVAWPNEASQSDDYAITIRYLGSLIATMTLNAKEVRFKSAPAANHPVGSFAGD
jgi:cytochrome d ubiquinol oxidase subunit I